MGGGSIEKITNFTNLLTLFTNVSINSKNIGIKKKMDLKLLYKLFAAAKTEAKKQLIQEQINEIEKKLIPPVQEKLTNKQITELIFDGIIRGENKFTMYFEDNTFIQQKHSTKTNLLLLYQRCNQYYGTTKIPVRVEDGWLENPNSIFSNSKITDKLVA